ncbi:hypothetical protein OIDMADRAFT_55308 [Oidiodendron maius Zn]|uniref:NmrA-like domain-containing protein n=1 Tax=Oidiodendron maius (strain Zn) TaxID=913774 RepID=A0A0C3GXF7_OIDMZ|nr:hypothetical protein OIDMADRAFT_55308 [Oidiodendron maius Zn]
MAEKKIITIVGVSGNQKSASVADIFTKEGGWHIRGITRDPSKPASQAWADKGVELITADVNDAASLKTAFAESTAIFGVTDFWALWAILLYRNAPRRLAASKYPLFLR